MTSLHKTQNAMQVPDMGVTVAEAVSFIVEALKYPNNPRWCGPCIMVCFMVIQIHHQNVESVKRHHSLGSTVVAFLTAKRSIADIEALDARWARCQCSPAEMRGESTATAVHFLVAHMGPYLAVLDADPENQNRAIGRFRNEIDTLGAVIHGLVQFLEDALIHVKPFSVAKGRHPEIWPATPKDLIPYGPEITVESLVALSRIVRSANAFSLVGPFIRICGPLIIPALVSSPTAAEYFVEYGLQICADISNSPLTPVGQFEEVAVEKFCGEVLHFFIVIMALLSLPPLLNRDFQLGHAEKSFEFLTNVISIIESPTLPQYWKQLLAPGRNGFARYAAALYTTCAEQMSVPKHRVHRTIYAYINHMSQPQTPAELAWQMIRFSKTLPFCFAVGCSESAQSSGPVYKRCSGCSVVAYSSKECQKRAWTDKHLPHRAICKKMKQVVDAGGSDIYRSDDHKKFTQDMKKANVDDSVLQEVGTWLSLITTQLQRKDPLSNGGAPEYSVGNWARLPCRYVP